jgi:hypothetical protein
MTLRTVVLPLGFGLSAVLCSAARGTPDDASGRTKPPVRLYTNEDLDRVRPFRDETGVSSVPAVPAGDRETRPPAGERQKARGEAYWRREAERVRDRVQAVEARAAELRAQIAERAEEASRGTRGRRSSSGSGSTATLRAKLASLESRIRQLEDNLAERARREGALPGWLR